jgi:chemotaxis protein methyltransferase CheR
VKAPIAWDDRWQEAFRELCSSRWGFRYKPDDAFTLRDLVDRAYQASDLESVDAFYALLQSLTDTSPEVQAFIGQMVVGETSFFRNQPQFSALAVQVFPDLIEERRRIGDRRLRIWSAGCASGEEPYSVAILLALLLEDWQAWDIKIIGTDINPFALRRASEALYSEWSFREADPEIVAKFFTPVSRLRRLDHPCKKMVSFRRQNLATDPIPDPESGIADLDVILCRNVTIYFYKELTARLAAGFFEALKPGGWLVVGHTEPDTSVYAPFEAHEFPDTILYRRPPPEPLVAAAPVPARSGSGPLTPSGEEEPLPPPKPAPTLADALAAYDAHDLALAYEVLVLVSQLQPRSPDAPHLLAQVSADEKRYDEAVYWAVTALQRDGFHVPTLLLLGLVFLERDDPERAKVQFQQAIFNDPTAPEAHLYMSMAQRALGRTELADRSRERAARLARDPRRTGEPLLPVQRPRRYLAEG